MKVEQILQSKGTEIFAVSENDTIEAAVGVLNEKNIGAVVVRGNGGEVVGILSERDIVRQLGEDGLNTLSRPVSACMTANPFTCSPQSSVDDVMAQMTEKRVRHLPVMNGGDMLGVISIGDVVKRKIEQAEQEAKALKDYIAS